jgi:ABC-2 type transport system permease protein
MKTVTYLNPFFYFIDSMRYATLGFHESNLLVGAIILGGLIVALGGLVIHLFRIGWRLRE